MNWIVVNLALAVFWLFMGAGILIVERIRGESLFGGVIISPGWLALLLAGYNVVRVVTMWNYAKEQWQVEAERDAARALYLHERPDKVVNPEFRFTEEEPRRAEERQLPDAN